MEIYVKNNFLFPYLLFVSSIHHDFVLYIDFTHVSASNRAIDDVIN